MPWQRKNYVPPAYLHTGSEITVRLSGPASGTVHATVLRHLPFTTFQVVLCELTTKSGSHPVSLGPGARFVLKIFDPRYHTRGPGITPHIQWSYALERKAFPRHSGQLTRWCCEPNPLSAGLSNWEEFFFLRAKTSQMCEVESYQCLAPLQGSAVPLFYGYGDLDLSEADPRRTIKPPLILIEYIDKAATLNGVNGHVLDPNLVESFIHAIDRMGEFGASNNDLNPGNYIFAPADKPTRILLIDWAHACLREPEESDESWTEEVRCNGAVRYTKRILAKKYSDAGLPIPACCTQDQTL